MPYLPNFKDMPMYVKTPSDRLGFELSLCILDMEVEYWYSYVLQGLANRIEGHSRKDQRTYQRKLNSWLARRNTFKSSYPEFLL